jgi:hypothetical protein
MSAPTAVAIELTDEERGCVEHASRQRLAHAVLSISLVTQADGRGRPSSVISEPSRAMVHVVRNAAVHNILADRRALALKHVPKRAELGRVMSTYMARSALHAHVREALSALRKVTSWPGWEPPRDIALKVTHWSAATVRGTSATVRFVGYESSRRGVGPRIALPRQRYVVKLQNERGWKTVEARTKWLTSEGPLGPPGDHPETMRLADG